MSWSMTTRTTMHCGCQFQPNSSGAVKTEDQADIRTGSFGKFYWAANVAVTEYVKTGNGNTDYEMTSSNVYIIVGEKLPVLANQL